jgi:hypothetical protein
MNHSGFGFEGCFSDFDNDHDLDLLIANDFGYKKTPNIILRNDFPVKTLKDRSINLAFNYGMNAMGIAPCDYNQDGWMDYFISNISASVFIVNQKNSKPFVNQAPDLGLAIPTVERPNFIGPPISWGANFFDFDHDTDQDLFVCNGALNPTIRQNYNFFFVLEDGHFKEVAESAHMDDPRIARGSAVFDYDLDGDLDLFVVNQSPRDPTDILPRARCLLYRNNRVDGNWIQIALEGVQAEMNGIGSRIDLIVGGKLLIREIDGGSSHLSQSTTTAHFGLAAATKIDTIKVKWLGGHTQILTDVPVNQRITIRESSENLVLSGQSELKIYGTIFENSFFGDYQTSSVGAVEINLLDLNGKILYPLANSPNGGPRGSFYFDRGNDLPSGIYLVQLLTGNQKLTRKVIKL